MDLLIDVIFGSGLNPVSVTIGTLVFLCGMCLWVAFSMAKFKQGPISSSQKGFLEKEERLEMIRNVTRIFETFNMKTIQSTTTEMMYYMCECTCKILQKAGVKKSVHVELDKAKEGANSCQLVMEDGKNDGTIDIVYCSYSETYTDSVTDKVLYKKEYPVANIVFSAIRSSQADRSATRFCTQCGAPLQGTGDFLHCDHCGAHYNTDAFLWTVSGMQVMDYKKQDIQGKSIMLFECTLLGASIIANFVQNPLLNLAIYGVNVALLVGMGSYFWSGHKKLAGLKACKSYDPLFSRDAFQRRVEYLYRLYNLSKDLDITKIKPFMDDAGYQKLAAQSNGYDAFYYLDNQFKRLEIPAFKVEAGKQWLNCRLVVDEVTINAKKRICKSRKGVRMVLVRNEHCLTNQHSLANQTICENCRANVNLALGGKCNHCGTPIDLLRYDWCIHSIEE